MSYRQNVADLTLRGWYKLIWPLSSVFTYHQNLERINCKKPKINT